jgi:hypothetical protein
MFRAVRITLAGVCGLPVGALLALGTVAVCEVALPSADFPFFRRLALLSWITPPVVLATVAASVTIGNASGRPRVIVAAIVGCSTVALIVGLLVHVFAARQNWTIL